MENITFDCEIITPMFLAGADGTTPELRAPSIKGALRFWWRAVNGHLPLFDKKDELLKTLEGEIFGSTTARSKVIIRCHPLQTLQTAQTSPLPHRQRSYIKEGFAERQRFKVILSLQRNVIYKNKVIFNQQSLISLFTLVSVLGGLGNRSRKGFGSFKIINHDYPQTLADILTHLHHLSPYFKLEPRATFIFSEKQKFNDYPYIEKIEIGRPKAEVLKRIGQTTHDLKRDWGKTYDFSLGHPNRLASPMYVSVLDTKEGLRPIITSLKTVPLHKYQRPEIEVQKQFKNTILR